MNKFLIQRRKIVYYGKSFLALFIPKFFFRIRIDSELKKINNYDLKYLESRVNYYNKIEKKFQLDSESLNINELFKIQIKKIKSKAFQNKKIKKRTTYFFDLYKYLSYFPPFFKVRFKFGDITENFSFPIIVKSRPIDKNKNSVIMKLNEVRHFYFLNDNKKFTEKKDMAVWRGNSKNSEARLNFVKNYYDVPIYNIGQHNPKVDKPWYRGYMPISRQLCYKFIFCIEGADTATNIKWVMSSNSLCVMPKPKYETWFMEGRLIKDFHYIEVENDFSDAEDKIQYYLKNIDKSIKIIENANQYIKQFKDLEQERLISLMVLNKFFKYSDQTN